MVSRAVLLLVRVVRVSGAESVLDLLVVAGARVGILDEDADRRAGRAAFEHPRENSHLIALATLTHEMRRPRAPAVHVDLQVRFGKRQTRRAAVDDAAHRRAVALAESRDRKQFAYRVTRHTLNAVAQR